MAQRTLSEELDFTTQLDKFGGWQDDDVDMVMRAALVAMTVYPEKQPYIDKAKGIQVVETEPFKQIPALEILFRVKDEHTVVGLDILEYPSV